MKSSFFKTITIFGILAIGFISCGDLISYSETPAIKYLDHIAKDSIDEDLGNRIKYVELKFSIVDGDGDFGLTDADTLEPFDSLYYNNFYSTLYGYSKGDFDSVAIANPNYRIKYVEIEDQKAYKADIYIEFEYFDGFMEYDTIKYDFYVVDKALNHSNTATTPDIVFE